MLVFLLIPCHLFIALPVVLCEQSVEAVQAAATTPRN